MKASNLNHLWAKMLVEELIRCGVSEFCISPGSRSTPLAIAVAQNHEAHCVVHFDERGSAFRALGLAKATGRPAVLICTSGTAAANFFPAVVEASQSTTPMMILTADRPAELRSCGSSQTIDQVKLFGNYVRWNLDLLPPDQAVPPNHLLTAVDQAVYRATASPAGPVHLNLQFREPLAPLEKEREFPDYLSAVSKWLSGSEPYTRYGIVGHLHEADSPSALIDAIKSAGRGVIVVGALPAYRDASAIVELAEKWRWPLIADICSGLRFGGYKSANTLCHADLYLRNERILNRATPDVVLQFGMPPISKAVTRFAASASAHCIIVNDRPDRIDPHHSATDHVSVDPGTIAAILLRDCEAAPSQLLNPLKHMESLTQDLLRTFNASASKSPSELQIAAEVVRMTSSTRGLFLATSMPIREVDAIAQQSETRIHVAANRGANGIDGTIATAVGFSDGLGLPLTLLIGDLATLHDLNSLALMASSRHPVTAIILNNDGGGIFSLLPVASMDSPFEQFFGTPHGRDFRNAAEMFGIKYHAPTTLKDFITVYRHSQKSKKPAIIEMTGNRQDNARLHNELWSLVEGRIEKQIGK